MSWATVQGLLDGHLRDFAAAQTPATNVAWEGIKFSPPAKAHYLRPHFLPASLRMAALGVEAQDIQRGIYQVDIMDVPGSGRGNRVAVADALRAHFARGLKIEGEEYGPTGAVVHIESTSIGPVMVDDTRFKLPVSIVFRAYMDPA